ncbi:ARM repeat superfamily protein [Pelomyxa schiedti]|nr:ARM repeat superfamily protein [Pelomyxa schiedti]
MSNVVTERPMCVWWNDVATRGQRLRVILGESLVRGADVESELALVSLPGYAHELCAITIDPNEQAHIRQLAGILLKNFVKHHWSSLSKDFRDPQLQDEEKALIKQMIPRALADPQSKIRTAAAMVISTIAYWDWPKQWPDLIPSLSQCLSFHNPDLVHGSLRCLQFLLSDKLIDDETVPLIISTVVPELLRVFCLPDCNCTFKLQIVSILHNFLEWSSFSEHETPTVLFSNTLSLWLDAFTGVLQSPIHPQFIDIPLRIVTLNVIGTILPHCNRNQKPLFIRLIPVILQMLRDYTPLYEKNAVLQNEEIPHDEAATDDGEMHTHPQCVNALILCLLEFINTKFLRPHLTNHLEEIMASIIACAQITHQQVEEWLADLNAFVQCDIENELCFNQRASCAMISLAITKRYGRKGAIAVLNSCWAKLSQANQMKQANNPQWWSLREASLRILEEVLSIVMSKHEDSVNSTDLMTLLINEDCTFGGTNVPQYHFVAFRGLMCCSELASNVPVELVTRLMSTLFGSLHTSHPIIKIGACKAATRLFLNLDEKVACNYVSSALAGISSLLPGASDEVLILLLTALDVALSVSSEQTLKFEPFITPPLLQIWVQHASDFVASSEIPAILNTIIKQAPNCLPGLMERISPVFTVLLSKPDENSNLIPPTLGTLTHIINKSTPFAATKVVAGPTASISISLIPGCLHSLFNQVVGLLTVTEDCEIVESGATVISACVHCYGPSLAEIPGTMQQIEQLMLHLLADDECGDYGAAGCALILTSILKKFPGQLASSTLNIVKGVISKLTSVQTVSGNLSILIVPIRLLHINTNETMTFFLAEGIVDLIGTKWAKFHKLFANRGEHMRLESLVGLCKFFLGLFAQNHYVDASTGKTLPLVQDIFGIFLNEYYKEIKNPVVLNSDSDGDSEGEATSTTDAQDSTAPTFAPLADYVHLVDGDELDQPEPTEEDADYIQDETLLDLDIKEYIEDFFQRIIQDPVILRVAQQAYTALTPQQQTTLHTLHSNIASRRQQPPGNTNSS